MIYWIKIEKEAAMKTDENGLELSNQSSSGYRFVALYEGKTFVAFADVVGDELQKLNQQHTSACDFYGFKNVVALGEFDDVRDAAYVGQKFYGSSVDERDQNLEEFFAGNTSVIATPPMSWKHDPDFIQIDRAKERTANRKNKVYVPKKDVQTALYDYYKDTQGQFKVTKDDTSAIRQVMEEYIDLLDGRPNNNDYMDAAKNAFEAYRI